MKGVFRLSACAWLLLVGPAQAAGAQVVDRVLARVGQQVITLSDVRAAITLHLVPSAKGGDPIAAALEILVDRQLMLAEATRYAAPSPDPAGAEARFREIRSFFASDADWTAALESSAMTVERLRDVIRDNLRVDAYVDQLFAQPAAPTDEEVARYYEQHRGEFVKDGRQLSLDEARDLVRERATAARRQALVAEWLTRLRSRAEIVLLYPPPR